MFNNQEYRSNVVNVISSDEDDDIKSNIINVDAISVDSSDNSDIEMTDIQIRKPRTNDVWRNIIECDILDQSVRNIGLKRRRVEREVESYELPYNNKRKHRYVKRRRNVNSKICCMDFEAEDHCYSSSEDDVKFLDKKPTTDSNKSECIVLDDDSDSISLLQPDTDTDSSSSDSDSDVNDVKKFLSVNSSRKPAPVNPWLNLIDKAGGMNEEYHVEFETGRRQVAIRIAGKLNEPKIDLIDRCLLYLGLKKCRVFLEAVKEIEDSGGMPTKDGSRRRTAGGVFFTLIRSDRTVDKEIKKQIFQEEDRYYEDESLWWKSIEIMQYRRNPKSIDSVSNFARRKEFKSYTLIDLDFFESIRDFNYRYIPIMSNFPIEEDSHPWEISDGDSAAAGGGDADDGDTLQDTFLRFPDDLDPNCRINL